MSQTSTRSSDKFSLCLSRRRYTTSRTQAHYIPGSFVGRCWSDILRLAYNTSNKKACLLLPRRHTVIPPPIKFVADDIFNLSQQGHSGDVSLLEIPSPMDPTTSREILPTTQELFDPSVQITSPSPIHFDRAIPMSPSHRQYSLGQKRPSTLVEGLGSPCSSTDTNVSFLIETIAQKQATRDSVHVQVQDELTTNTNSDQWPNEQQGLDYGKKSNFLNKTNFIQNSVFIHNMGLTPSHQLTLKIIQVAQGTEPTLMTGTISQIQRFRSFESTNLFMIFLLSS